MTTLSARQFNHDVSAAKRAAIEGPVIITDHGRPSHVLLSIADYEELARVPRNIVEALKMDEDVEFDELDEVRLDLRLRVPEW